MRIMFKPTGNVFDLPDEEALKIKREDRADEYKILDAGYVEGRVVTLPEQTVKDIVLKDEETKRKLEEEEEKEQLLVEEKKRPKTMRPLDQLSRAELIAYAKKMGIKTGTMANCRIIEAINKKLGK